MISVILIPIISFALTIIAISIAKSNKEND